MTPNLVWFTITIIKYERAKGTIPIRIEQYSYNHVKKLTNRHSKLCWLKWIYMRSNDQVILLKKLCSWPWKIQQIKIFYVEQWLKCLRSHIEMPCKLLIDQYINKNNIGTSYWDNRYYVGMQNMTINYNKIVKMLNSNDKLANNHVIK